MQELTSRLDEQGRILVDRDYAADQMRSAATTAQKTEADLRTELAELANRMRNTTDGLQAEKTLVERQLKLADEDRSKLQREIETMKREAEAAWAAERMENAVMRERINDVAAEVARLTSLLEGPGSPIDAILSGDAGRAHAPVNGNGHGVVAGNGEGGSKGTLADRIRALQSRASRVPQATRA